MIFGEEYKVEDANVEKPYIEHTQKKITLNRVNPKHREQLTQQLKKILKTRVNYLVEEYAARMGVKPEKIIIRRQSTKWGSCSTNGSISLNLRLVCLPEETLRYVLYHEMSHLKIRKHDKLFWNMISQEYPNYVKKENELQQEWFRTEKLFQNLWKNSTTVTTA